MKKVKKTATIAGAALPVLAMTMLAAAGAPEFVIIGDGDVVDMTPDGTYVVGNNGDGAYRWSEATGMVTIPDGEAVAISDDGTIILGQIDDPKTGRNAAGLWTEATGWVSLGGLPGETGCDANLSNPYDLSGAGDVAVGLGWEGCSGRAFRWTDATGMLALDQIGPNSARANAVSGDGGSVGGWDESAAGTRRASVWTNDGTEILPLEGHPDNPTGAGEVWGFSTSGNVVVGQAHQDLSTGGGFRFMNGTVNILPPLPGTDPVFHTIAAFATSDDGVTVVGTNLSGFGPFAPRDATIWSASEGAWEVQKLQDVLAAAGTKIPDDLTLASADAISPDGRIIAGFALNGFARTAFIVRFPGGGSCPQDIDGDGQVGFLDLLSVLSAWGPCP